MGIFGRVQVYIILLIETQTRPQTHFRIAFLLKFQITIKKFNNIQLGIWASEISLLMAQ